MTRLVLAVAVMLALGACGKSSSEQPRGLPPPGQVELPEPAMGQPLGKTNAVPTPQRKVDPHAGLDIANDPRAGMFAKPNDGEAGEADVADPHAGAAQALDPSKYLKGTIAISGELAAQVAAGDILFVGVARKSDGQTLAMARFDVTKLPMPFSIDAESAIFTGNAFDGEVVVVARLDRDGEARTRKPGDLEGTATATIPTDSVELTLSKVLE